MLQFKNILEKEVLEAEAFDGQATGGDYYTINDLDNMKKNVEEGYNDIVVLDDMLKNPDEILNNESMLKSSGIKLIDLEYKYGTFITLNHEKFNNKEDLINKIESLKTKITTHIKRLESKIY